MSAREPRRWAVAVALVVVVTSVRLTLTVPPLSGGTVVAGLLVVLAAGLVWGTGRPVGGAR